MGSSIPTNQYDGDVSVGRSVAVGGNAKVSGSMRVGHNLTVDGWIDAKNIKGPGKGLFKTVEKLRAAHPIPHDGWWALVGDSLPAPIYVADGGEWVATGEQGGTPVIDDTETKEEIERLNDDLNTLKGNVNTKASSDDLSKLVETVEEKASSEDLNKLNQTVSNLLEGAVYCGLSTPDLDPGTPEQKVFYLASGAGTYVNFDELSVTETEVAFLYYDGSSWAKHSLDLSSTINELKSSVETANTNAGNALRKAIDAVSSSETNAKNISVVKEQTDRLSEKVDGMAIPKLQSMTQTAYDALESKDSDTTYLITEE